MKCHFHFLVGIMAFLSMTTIFHGVETATELKSRMNSPDSKVRSAAINDFLDSLGTVDGQTYILEATPILVSGLSDPDVNVRRNALEGLFMVAGQTIPIARQRFSLPLPSGKPDLLKYDSLQQTLLSFTSDPDISVRETALETYALIYKLSPYLESKIIEEFNSTESRPEGSFNKIALLELLMVSGSPSPTAESFLIKLLDDPRYEWHIINRIGTDGCPLSSEVLAKLADILSKESDGGHKQNLVRAIGIYGSSAALYLPLLQKMLAGEAPGSGLRLDLQTAIKQIREAVQKPTLPATSPVTPQPSSTPRVAPIPSAAAASSPAPILQKLSAFAILPITICGGVLLIGIVVLLSRRKS